MASTHYLPTQLIKFGDGSFSRWLPTPLLSSPEDILVSTFPAKKLRQVSSTVISLASLLCRSDFPDISLGAQLPHITPECQKHEPEHLGCSGVHGWGRGGKGQQSERPPWVPTSLCSLCRQSSSVSSISLSAKVSTHTLRKSPLQTRSRGADAALTRHPRHLPRKRPAQPHQPSRRVGPAPGVGAAALLPVTVPALRIHTSRAALSLEAQESRHPLCTSVCLLGRAGLGVDGCLEQAEGNQCWGPKCLRRRQGRGSQAKDQTSDSSFPSSMLTSQLGHKGPEPCGQV